MLLFCTEQLTSHMIHMTKPCVMVHNISHGSFISIVVPSKTHNSHHTLVCAVTSYLTRVAFRKPCAELLTRQYIM